jgi:group I intron endonuclease
LCLPRSYCTKPNTIRSLDHALGLLTQPPVKVWPNAKECRSALNEYKGKAGIYLWYNSHTGNTYVGSAKDLHKRLSRYYLPAELNRARPLVIYKAITKYGHEGFSLVILEVCGLTKDVSKEKLLSREQYFVDTIKPTYNVLKLAGSSQGYKHTEDTKNKMKDIYSDARREHARNINLGKPLSEVTKQKLSAVIRTQEQRELAQLSCANREEVQVYNSDGSLFKEYLSINQMAKEWNACRKYLSKVAKSGKLYRGKYYIKLKDNTL